MTLLEMLRRYSYKEGTFTLASGKESDFYIDCKQTIMRSDGLRMISAQLDDEIRAKFPTASAVAGEGVGGAPLAIGVCMFSSLTEPFHHPYRPHRWKIFQPVIIRKKTKDHGTTQRVERSKELVPKHSSVVLVEDVLTTGGSALRALEALYQVGLNPLGVIALVDRCEGAKELLGNYKVVSLYNRTHFL